MDKKEASRLRNHSLNKVVTNKEVTGVCASFFWGKKTYKVSEAASLSVLRLRGLEGPTVQGQIETSSKTGKRVLPICT
jgi:hypothetical protein